MFIEICFISYAFYSGSKLYKKNKEQQYDKKKQYSNTPDSQSSKAIQKRRPDPLDIEEFVNRRLWLTLGNTALASTGALFFPPLKLLSIFSLLYLILPVFQKAKESIFQERRARIEIFDSVGVIFMLGSGYIVTTNLAFIAYWGAQKLRLTTENNSRESLINIFGEQPRSVWILKDGVEIEVPFESLEVEEILVSRAGEQIPADGVVIHGIASVDQHMLTGEAQPAEKGIGDRVFSATVVISGWLHIRVEKAGKATVAAEIGEILENTTNFTSALESQGKAMADASTIPAFVLALGSFPVVGFQGTVALFCSNFLINMRMFSPISMLNFLNMASQEGVLIKDGRSLQTLAQVDTVVFDKTGTLTLEQPRVRSIYTFNGRMKDDGNEENKVLAIAATAEYRQSHPIALAILGEAGERGLDIAEIDEANYKIGYGITVKTEGKMIRVGSQRFMETENIPLPKTFSHIAEQSYEQGYSLVYVASDEGLIGVIEMESAIRPEAKQVIQLLKKRSMTFYIISGDHETPTRKMAEKLGIEHWFAHVLPRDKAKLIEELQEQGRKVCFVGDGINDGIALKKADVSVSMRGASTIATDSAQIVLMDETLEKLPGLFDISHRFQDNMKNAFLATGFPQVISIGGVFFYHFTIMHTLLMYIVSVASGGTVVMLPAIKKRSSKKKKKATVKRE